MRIAIVNCFDYFSTGDISFSIAKYCDSKGDEIKYFAGETKRGAPFENNITKNHSFDKTVSKAFGRLFGLDGFLNNRATIEMLKDLSTFKPDVINCHVMHGFYLNAEKVISFSIKSGIPLIFTLHDCWLATGRCGFPETCEKWKTDGCEHCPKKKLYPRTIFTGFEHSLFVKKDRLINQLGDKCIFVSPSHWLSEIYKRRFSSSKARFLVIENGVDKSIFAKSDLKKLEVFGTDKTVLLGVASFWGDRKGISFFNQLAQILPTKTFQIVLIGEEDSTRPIDSRIKIIPTISDKTQIAKYYSCCDYFVNLSIADNFPTTILEARACGARIITFDSGGSGEAAGRHGVFGVGSIKEIADYLKTNVDDSRSAGAPSGIEDMDARYYELFHSLMKK